MKVSQLLTKTIKAATPAALDTDFATFVQTLTEEQLVGVHFSFRGPDAATTEAYVVVIVYTQ